MRASLVFSVCFVAALSAVHADTGAAPHTAPHAVHHQQQVGRQPHQLQQQQPAFGQQQQQQAAPLPYPLRRQSGSGLERARDAVMGMLESIMNAGARFRRMASARLATMMRRRASPAAPLKRAYHPQQPQSVAHHQPQHPGHQHQPAPQAVPQAQQPQQQQQQQQ